MQVFENFFNILLQNHPPTIVLYPNNRTKSLFLSKKMPECLRICNFCCTFAPKCMTKWQYRPLWHRF